MPALPTIVCDVNETLLDLSALRPAFQQQLGDAVLMPVWFGLLLRQALVTNATDRYLPFDQLAEDALRLLIWQRRLDADESVAAGFSEAMLQLPAHADVVIPGLRKLREAGFDLVTLTNSRLPVVEEQLRFAGIEHYFDRLFSVDAVRRFKPAAQPYQHVAAELAAAPAALVQVAAHDWDITGAVRAGWRGAFIARMGAALPENGETPDVSAPDLDHLETRLIDHFS